VKNVGIADNAVLIGRLDLDSNPCCHDRCTGIGNTKLRSTIFSKSEESPVMTREVLGKLIRRGVQPHTTFGMRSR
jgi:hypothetical protein